MKSLTIPPNPTAAKEYFLQQVQMVKVRNAKTLQKVTRGTNLGSEVP